MLEFLSNITDFIVLNFLFVFGSYSLIYSILKWTLKDNERLKDFDRTAIKAVLWVGTIWVGLKFIEIIVSLYELKKISSAETFPQHFNWFIGSSWPQWIWWVFISQAVRFSFIRNFLIPRLLVAVFFVCGFRQLEYILIDFHRDYLPETDWTIESIGSYLGILVLKTLGFVGIVFVIHRFFVQREN